MDKKIIFNIIIPFFLAMSCQNTNLVKPNGYNIYYDTLLYSNDNSKIEISKFDNLQNHVKIFNNGIGVVAKRPGATIWIDSVLYQNVGTKAIFVLANVNGLSSKNLLYYNKDSLLNEIIGVNDASFDVYKGDKTTLIKFVDTINSFSYQVLSINFFKINGEGEVEKRIKFSPRRNLSENKSDFDYKIEEVFSNKQLEIVQTFNNGIQTKIIF